jgi:hypothetical protein
MISICCNLQEDPAETCNLSEKYPEIVERLQKEYATWMETVVGSHADIP